MTENETKKVYQELEQYRSIGTVEECQEAMERQRAKQPFLVKNSYWCCPCCCDIVGQRIIFFERIQDKLKKNYCENCGTSIDWSDNNA